MTRRTSRILLMVIICSTVSCLQEVSIARQRTRLRTRSRGRLKVVTTLPDYAVLAKRIGGDRVDVESIVQSVQDPHHIRPKPSFVHLLMGADVLIATGLDLELWLPTVINKSGNKRVRSGEPGYVAVSQGIKLLEVPKVVSQFEGDVHVYGNPHLTCSPINTREIVRNITTGLIKNDAQGRDFYEENLRELQKELDTHLFGEELVKLLGGKTLCALAEKDKLINFLQEHELQGEPLMEKLGGWMKKMLPLRGTPIVVYHKNWTYFIELFGLEEAGTIETKPGIPPSLKHVTELVSMMQEREIGIILAANYFDQQKVTTIGERTGAKAVIVPLFVGGAPGIDDYSQLVDYWTDRLLAASTGG